jgi:release factor glutamine methyltransferase
MTVCSQQLVMPLEAVHAVERELRAAGVPSPRVDAEILVADVLGLARSELYSSGRDVSDFEAGRLRELVERRVAREPLAYILGEWGFRRLDLKVDERALIPRPETEVVVERCLDFLRAVPEPRVLDVGVGSGAIALAIADEHRGAEVLAVDSSPDALALARENLSRASVNGRVRLVEGNLLSDVRGPFDLVVSNPPYVSPEEYETLQPEIRLYEPYRALVGVGVGREVAAQARRLLRPGGRLVLECGDGQAAELAAALEFLGYAEIRETPDLAGRDRVVEGSWGGS